MSYVLLRRAAVKARKSHACIWYCNEVLPGS